MADLTPPIGRTLRCSWIKLSSTTPHSPRPNARSRFTDQQIRASKETKVYPRDHIAASAFWARLNISTVRLKACSHGPRNRLCASCRRPVRSARQTGPPARANKALAENAASRRQPGILRSLTATLVQGTCMSQGGCCLLPAPQREYAKKAKPLPPEITFRHGPPTLGCRVSDKTSDKGFAE